MVLVDTSVWIDVFRGVDSPEVTYVVDAMNDDEDLCICGPILMELLQGIRSEPQCHKVKQLLSPFRYLSTPRSTYLLAADIYRAASARGTPVRSAIDCIIAACAIENDVAILHRDNDFSVIAAVSKLKVVSCE
jgi:hypothetical protein